MKPKFKIGDEVRQNSKEQYNWQSNNYKIYEGCICSIKIGTETILSIHKRNNTNWYKITNYSNYFREDLFELVKQKKITDWRSRIQSEL